MTTPESHALRDALRRHIDLPSAGGPNSQGPDATRCAPIQRPKDSSCTGPAATGDADGPYSLPPSPHAPVRPSVAVDHGNLGRCNTPKPVCDTGSYSMEVWGESAPKEETMHDGSLPLPLATRVFLWGALALGVTLWAWL